jgi:hypothetical protein
VHQNYAEKPEAQIKTRGNEKKLRGFDRQAARAAQEI